MRLQRYKMFFILQEFLCVDALKIHETQRAQEYIVTNFML
jgi:hypothetical protein